MASDKPEERTAPGLLGAHNDSGTARQGASVIQLIERMKANRRRSLVLLLLLLLLIGGCSATVLVADGSPPATPPVPLITSTPSDPTSATRATFHYSDSSSRAQFRCSIDGSQFEPCPLGGVTYTNLPSGAHRFQVEAALGRATSEAATFHWTILGSSSYQPVRIPPATVPLPSGNTSSPPSNASPASPVTTLAPNNAASTSSRPTTSTTAPPGNSGTTPTTSPPATGLSPSISGNLTSLLYPGVSRVLDLVFTNPNSVPVTVGAGGVQISISTNQAGCPAATNFSVDRGLTTGVTIPANSAKSLAQLGVASTHWPVIGMIDTHTNQDSCENATLILTYTVEVTG